MYFAENNKQREIVPLLVTVIVTFQFSTQDSQLIGVRSENILAAVVTVNECTKGASDGEESWKRWNSIGVMRNKYVEYAADIYFKVVNQIPP